MIRSNLSRLASVLALTTWVGCGSSVVKRGDDESSPKPGTAEHLPGFADACPLAGAWPTACLTIDDGDVTLFDLDTGARCSISSVMYGELNGFALHGDDLAFCEPGLEGIVSVHVPTGVSVMEEGHCFSMAESGDELFVLEDPGVVEAPDLESYVAGASESTEMQPHASVLAADEEVLYAAWHSASELTRYDLGSQQEMAPLLLQGFDDWVHGIATLEDGRVVIRSRERIVIFDAEGALTEEPSWSLDGGGGGLRCWQR